MHFKNKILSWEFIIIFSGRLLNGLLLLAATRVYSSLLSDYEIGRLAIILSFLFLFTSLVLFPIGSFINQRILSWLKNSLWQPYLATYFLSIFMMLFILATPVLILGYYNILIAIFYLLALCINQTLIPIINIMLYRKMFVFITLSTSALYILLSYIFISHLAPSAEYWLLGQSISNIIFGIIALFTLIYLTKSRFLFKLQISSFKNTKKLLNFAAPLIVTSLVSWSILNFYKISAGYVFGIEAIAVIALCSVLSNGIFGAIESATIQLYHANYLQKLSIFNDLPNRKIAFEEFFANVMLILTVALLILILISPQIISFALDDRFHSYFWLLQLFFLVDYFRNFTHIISQFAYAEFKTSVLISGNLVSVGISILLVCVSFISSYWVMLMPISLTIAYMSNSYIQYRKLCNLYGDTHLLPFTKKNMIIIFFVLIFVYVVSNIL